MSESKLDPIDQRQLSTETGEQLNGSMVRAWLSMVAVAIGVMVVQIDGTVVSVANPAIAAALHASLEGIQWVTSGYLLVLAGLLIPAGTLADKIGRKKAFLIGIGGFTLASLLCGLAGSIEFLVGARVLQAAFAALLVPAALAVIRTAFPAEKLAMAIGIFSSFTSLALAGGPILGGVLVQFVAWEWVFFINLPLGVLGVVLGMMFIQESAQGTPRPLDTPGALTLTLAMVSIIWSITHVQRNGWVSLNVLGFLLLGLVLLAVFVVIERRSQHPMVPLSLFRNRSLSVGAVIMIVTMFAFYAILFYLTFFLQSVQGQSGVMAGVALLPLTAVFTVSSPIGGWVTGKLGTRKALVLGAVLVAGALALLLRLETDSGMATLAPSLVLSGFGMGFMMVAATQAIVGSAPLDKAGVVSGVQQSMTQLGGVLGTSVFGTILASVVSSRFGGAVLGAIGEQGGHAVGRVIGGQQLRQDVELGFPPAAQHGLGQQLAEAGVPSGQIDQLVATVTRVAHHTFVEGLHTVFAVSVGVAMVAGLLSLLVREAVPAETKQEAVSGPPVRI